MLEEKNTFELEALQVNNAEGTTFEIKEFDNALATAKSICDSFVTFVIQNDEQNKTAKDFRAKCNKAKDQIKNLRLSTQKAVLGKFEEQCKQLEKIFDDKNKEIGVEVNAYAESKKESSTLVGTKAKEYKFKITFVGDKTLEKLIKFCETNNITLEEIKK